MLKQNANTLALIHIFAKVILQKFSQTQYKFHFIFYKRKYQNNYISMYNTQDSHFYDDKGPVIYLKGFVYVCIRD